jgi:periplasmic divalent cation tolerance protein
MMEHIMSNPEDIVVMFSTAPPAESASLARMLFEQRLVACVNIVPVRSLYRWNDNVCDEEEHLLVMKTVQADADRVITAIKEHHSYEVPEVIALPVTAGYPQYLDWVREETRRNA